MKEYKDHIDTVYGLSDIAREVGLKPTHYVSATLLVGEVIEEIRNLKRNAPGYDYLDAEAGYMPAFLELRGKG